MKEQKMIKRILYRCRQGYSTALVCFKQTFEGGFLKNISEQLLMLVQFIVLVFIWRGLARAGVDLNGMTEETLLTYTLVSFVFRWQMNILTPATSALWEGSVIRYYTRPMPAYLSYAVETIGKRWLPIWLFFGLPLVVIVAPILGVSPWPASPLHALYFVVSMLLSVVIGFGVDILFISLAIRLKNAIWMATQIRESIYDLLSGALIPFALLPAAFGRVFSLLPFGSIGSAPLTLYIGQGNPAELLPVQAFWAVAIWLIAHPLYKKSEERMISYGG